MKQLKIKKIPLHLEVQRRLHNLIKDDIYKVGERLPSEAELSTQLGISRPTLREALKSLEQEGLILRRHGIGTFVSSQTSVLQSGLEVLESLERQAQRIGLSIEVTRLNILERPAIPEELDMLMVSKDEPIDIINVDRVITTEGKPIAYLKDVVPKAYLRQEDLDDQFSGSVLDILLQRDAPQPVNSRTEIEAINSRADIASRLGIQRNTALLKLTAQLYSFDWKVMDYSVSYLIPGYFKFHTLRRVIML